MKRERAGKTVAGAPSLERAADPKKPIDSARRACRFAGGGTILELLESRRFLSSLRDQFSVSRQTGIRAVGKILAIDTLREQRVRSFSPRVDIPFRKRF